MSGGTNPIQSIISHAEVRQAEKEGSVPMSVACLLYVAQSVGDTPFVLWSNTDENGQVSEELGLREKLIVLANEGRVADVGELGKPEVDENRIRKWMDALESTAGTSFVSIERAREEAGKRVGILVDRLGESQWTVRRNLATLNETNIRLILWEEIKHFVPSELAPPSVTAFPEAVLPSVRVETIGNSTRAWVTLEAIPNVSALKTLTIEVENPEDEAYREAVLVLDSFPRTHTESVSSIETVTVRIRPGGRITVRFKTANENGILSDADEPVHSGRIGQLLTIMEEAKVGLAQGSFPATSIEFITSSLRQAQTTTQT